MCRGLNKILYPALLCSIAFGSFSKVQATDITGAGSSFVYPILSKWAETYRKESGHNVNYQSIGSGGGIKQIQSQTVDFGATDKPLSRAELDKDGLVQFPIVNGSVVPVINIQGIKPGELQLTGDILAEIYLGHIKTWNAKAISEINKGLKLPAEPITVVHRADSSGTTFIWSNYLSKVSESWKTKVGEGTAISWPVGIAGKGNEGVAAYVQKVKGSIGYVEYAYAKQSNMSYASMQNSAGKFVKADMSSFTAAASSAQWEKAESFNLVLTNAPGESSWPIAGSTFILMHKNPVHPERAKIALSFFRSAFSKKGADAATNLHYVPLPDNVVKMVETAWLDIKTQNGKPLL